MSLACMTWVLTNSDERLGRRLVLLVLADYAHDDGTRAFPSVDTMADKSRMSRSQVQRVLRQLLDSGAITKTGTTSTGTNIYAVSMEGSHIAAPPHPRSRGAANPQSASAEMRPDPELEPPLEQPLASLGGTRGAQVLPFKSLRGKPVKLDEAQLALNIVGTWNTLSGQRLVPTEARLKAILGRIREHPDLQLSDHGYLMRRLIEKPFGEGAAVINMLYGNANTFQVQRDKAEAGGGEGDAARVLRVAEEFERDAR